jgi:hypothetical protein
LTALVALVVVIVADAVPSEESDDGLIVQTGSDTVPCTEGVTVQAKVTGPTNPLPVVSVMLEEVTPPAETADSVRVLAVRVKSCAHAAGPNEQTVSRTAAHTTTIPLKPSLILDLNHLDLNRHDLNRSDSDRIDSDRHDSERYDSERYDFSQGIAHHADFSMSTCRFNILRFPRPQKSCPTAEH